MTENSNGEEMENDSPQYSEGFTLLRELASIFR